MKPEIQKIITQMLTGHFLDEGSQEAQLMQELRITNQETSFISICKALQISGSWYGIPTLMALMDENNSPQQHIALTQALAGIRSRINWDPLFTERLFKQQFWKTQWLAGPHQLLSFVTLITNLVESDNPEKRCEQVFNEIEYYPIPYSTFKDLRVCTPDWNFQNDLLLVIDNGKGQLALQDLVESLDIPSSLETIIGQTIRDMKSDYLITRLKLGEQYKQIHIGMSMAHNLNKKA